LKIPFVHITDLYHPPQDPDDHFDLATVMALPELDLRGVILDTTTKFLHASPQGFDIPRDPGFVPVAQLSYLLGRSIPTAVGPAEPLRDETDAVRDRPAVEQAGIELLLRILRSSSEPVVISMVGSARVVAAAFSREPELMRARTKTILLNAGATAKTKTEWNVDLDLFAYRGLWNSGLPIHWYPCATERGAFDENHEYGTHWKATHETLLRGLSPGLRAWFSYSLTGNGRGDIIRSLREDGKGAAWEHVLSGKRNLWSTASLVMAAGRSLAQTRKGWRFVSGEETTESRWPMFLDPITAKVREDGQVDWQSTVGATPYRIFRRQPGREFGAAMADALHALLQSLNC
jgi:pyrimidine-specific ribonucleoside hydrolase